MAKNLSNWSGTSFFDLIINCSANKLKEVFGEADAHTENINEKSQYNWNLQTDKGSYFCIYDWKEYREYDDDEKIEWHVGHKLQDMEDITNYLKKIHLLR